MDSLTPSHYKSACQPLFLMVSILLKCACSTSHMLLRIPKSVVCMRLVTSKYTMHLTSSFCHHRHGYHTYPSCERIVCVCSSRQMVPRMFPLDLGFSSAFGYKGKSNTFTYTCTHTHTHTHTLSGDSILEG